MYRKNVAVSFSENEEVLGIAILPILVSRIYPSKYDESLDYLFGENITPPPVDISGSQLSESRPDFHDYSLLLPIFKLRQPITQARIKNTSTSLLDEYITAMCTGFHETFHIMQASASTVGWWFAIDELVRLSKTFEYMKRIKEAGAKNIKIPLTKWGKQVPASKEKWTCELRNLSDYLADCHFLRAVLIGNIPISINQAIEEVSEVCAKRQANVELTTSLDPSCPVSPNNMNLVDIFESEAHFFQDKLVFALWEMAGAPAKLLKSVEKRMSYGPYIKAFNVFKSLLGPRPPANWSELFQIAIHIALFSPFFKPRFNYTKIHYKWEDIHPCWRFVRVVEMMSKMTLPDEPLREYENLSHNICTKLGWSPTPLEIISEVAMLDSKCDKNPIGRDLLDRFVAFSSHIIQKGLPRLYMLGPSWRNILSRTLPWFRQGGEVLYIQNIPPWISRQEALNLIIYYSILDDAIKNCDFSHSKGLLKAFCHYSIEQKCDTIQNMDEYFNQLVQDCLGWGLKGIAPA